MRCKTHLVRVTLLILLAASALLCGCETSSVEFKNPLSPPQLAKPDPKLQGLWRNKAPLSYMYIACRPDGHGQIMTFGDDQNGDIGTTRTDYFVTQAGRHTYLNLSHQVSSMNGKVQRDRSGAYTFAEYHFTWLGALLYSTPYGDLFADAVKSGRLKGRILSKNSDGTPADTFVTDSSGHVLGFIESLKTRDVFPVTYVYGQAGASAPVTALP